MRAPLFSVVIPTYNRSDLVVFAITSILKQTLQDFEIIVCDNCSTDDTRVVVANFTDSRLRYVCPPRHLVIADNWEFARSQAHGELVIMLADDDALVANALERFRDEYERLKADFLFCKTAEYRDLNFPGPKRNTLECGPFTGMSRVIATDEFLGSLYSLQSKFSMHPSAFVFSQAIVDKVTNQTGRFFHTNGVEYSAWPLAAVFAKSIAYIDTPLCLCGRTGKSGGSILRLGNPGKKVIDEFITNFNPKHKYVPLDNFTFINLWAEGVLAAKALLPLELGKYDFDEVQYLRSMMKDLADRKSMGVDVTREMGELIAYAAKYPFLEHEPLWLMARREVSLWRKMRRMIGSLGARRVVDEVMRYRDLRKVKRGDVRSGFGVFGSDFGFDDILGCALFLARNVIRI
jgi:glycosyltransferase involved in cell wall biosynthesis